MNHRFGLFSFFGTLVLIGCSVTTNAAPGGGSGPGSGGATAEQTDSCKKGCDKMKFFDCSSASEQAACYADCDSATPKQIEVFTACAENSICDPECRTTIKPAEGGSGGGSGGVSAGGGGASASSCSTACDKLISCSFIPVGAKSECNSQCAAKGYQYQIDCVNNNACGDIKSKCGDVSGGGSTEITIDGGGFGPDPVKDCQDECDDINFFDCAPVEKHSECRAKCSSATATVRDDFISCSKSSGVTCEKKAGCLDAFLK